MELPSYLEASLKAGESDRLEFKASIHEPLLLAKLIASLANARGGNILVGVSEIGPIVKGVDRARIERLFQSAVTRIEPPATAQLSFLRAGEKEIADISVTKSQAVVLVGGGAFIREGAQTRVMEGAQLLERQSATGKEITLEGILEENQKQTALLEHLIDQNDKLEEKNEELREKVDSLSDPALRRRERIIGGCIGVAASLIAAVIWLLATKQIPWLRSDPESSNTAIQLSRPQREAYTIPCGKMIANPRPHNQQTSPCLHPESLSRIRTTLSNTKTGFWPWPPVL